MENAIIKNEKSDDSIGHIDYVKDSIAQEKLTKANNKTTDYTKSIWAAIIIPAISVALTAMIGILGLIAVKQIINNQKQIQKQNQEMSQKQEIVTLQPRDGDVIIWDKETSSYKLVQLIKIEDIEFTTILQERTYSKDIEIKRRVDVQNTTNADWSNRNGYGYTLEKISINPDKMMNLYENIKTISAYVDFYSSADIDSRIDLGDKVFFIPIYDSGNKASLTNTVRHTSSNYIYVTNAGMLGNDGINHAKLRIEISYTINGLTFDTTIMVDQWLTIRN